MNFRALILLLLLSFAAAGNALADGLTKKIVILHSYIPGEWYHGLNRGFEESLGKLGVAVNLTPIVFDSEYWQDKTTAEREKERAKIVAQIKGISPDLVVICDDEAADMFVPAIYRSGFRMVFTGVNRSADQLPWSKEVPRNFVTGVVEIYPVSEFTSVLEKLLPNLKTISLLSSKKPSSVLVSGTTEAEMNTEQFKATHRIRLKSVNLLAHWEEWKERVEQLNEKDSAVWVLVPYDVRDTNNIQVPLPQMGRWFRKHLKTPYIGMSVVHTKMGGLMSVQITPFDLGRQAAELAAKFFNGKNLSELPIEKARYHQIEINVTEAKRLGVKVPKELYGVATMVEEPFLQYGR